MSAALSMSSTADVERRENMSSSSSMLQEEGTCLRFFVPHTLMWPCQYLSCFIEGKIETLNLFPQTNLQVLSLVASVLPFPHATSYISVSSVFNWTWMKFSIYMNTPHSVRVYLWVRLCTSMKNEYKAVDGHINLCLFVITFSVSLKLKENVFLPPKNNEKVIFQLLGSLSFVINLCVRNFHF